MPNGYRNWNFKQVVKILNANGFTHHHTKGSHYHYVGYKNKESKVVQVPFHGNKSIATGTMKSIIQQSGLGLKKWNIK